MAGSSYWLTVALVIVTLINSSCNGDQAFSPIEMILEDDNPTPQQPYRSGFHFQPPKNWMNDPNGAMYYKGIYHLFYQYNPYQALFGAGNISWGHSISQNMVDWVHLEHALDPSHPFDINGCWSGSATILLDGTPAILYTGVDSENRQVQNLAVAKNTSDPYLREWIKSDHNPLMSPVDGIGFGLFRDPTTAWKGVDGKWRVMVGSEINGHGAALLYRSEDFITWTKSDRPLHFSNKTTMWECPDFFPVSVNGTNGIDTSVLAQSAKHVLKASFNGHDYYVIGKYAPGTDEFVADVDFMDDNVGLRCDYGVYYASKTFYDSAQKRRILLAWILEADNKSDDLKKGWSGIHSFPRRILLDQGGKQLSQWPISEIERLRKNESNNIQNKHIEGGTHKHIEGGTQFEITGITASQADVEVSFHLPNLDGAELLHPDWHDPQLLCSKNNALAGGKFGPFGLLVLASTNLTEYTAIFFRIYKASDKFVVLMCSDQSRSSLREEIDKSSFGAFIDVDPTQKVSLRSLIDHSIIESFGGGGKACITARVYPQLAVGNEAHLHVFNYGTETIEILNLSAWSMEAAKFTSLHEGKKTKFD